MSVGFIFLNQRAVKFIEAPAVVRQDHLYGKLQCIVVAPLLTLSRAATQVIVVANQSEGNPTICLGIQPELVGDSSRIIVATADGCIKEAKLSIVFSIEGVFPIE